MSCCDELVPLAIWPEGVGGVSTALDSAALWATLRFNLLCGELVVSHAFPEMGEGERPCAAANKAERYLLRVLTSSMG